MRIVLLKINVNDVFKEIEEEYFKYRDTFYKCLIVNLIVFNSTKSLILHNVIIEDNYYNEYLKSLVARNLNLEQLIAEIDPIFAMSIFLDSNLYIEEFIQSKHDNNAKNLYSLTIDDGYNIVITNKQLRKLKC